MEQELYNEWCLLEKRSLELINNLKIRKNGKSRLLKIMESPSLCWDCVKRWELYEDTVVRIDWFCQEDSKKFHSADERAKHPKEICPTIRYRLHKVDTDYSESVMKELSNISIPLNAKNSIIGCDGTGYELELGSYWSNVKFKWWCEAPEQWKTLGDFTKRLMGEFDNILANEEYVDSLSFDGKLWLKPASDIKITKDLLDFLKQFTGFSGLNVIRVSELFRLEKPVLLETNFDYIHYKNFKKEFDKFDLKVEFEYNR